MLQNSLVIAALNIGFVTNDFPLPTPHRIMAITVDIISSHSFPHADDLSLLFGIMQVPYKSTFSIINYVLWIIAPYMHLEHDNILI